MIYNGFRRIALAQGLLPVRSYIMDAPGADTSTGVIRDLPNFPAQAADYARDSQAGAATQV